MNQDTANNKSDRIVKEILQKNPELSGIYSGDDIEIIYEQGNGPLISCTVAAIAPAIHEIDLQKGEEGKMGVQTEVSIVVSCGGIALYLDPTIPLYRFGVKKLGEKLSYLFSQMGFDFRTMLNQTELFYLARVVDGESYIAWADERFFISDEAKRINMIVIDALLGAECHYVNHSVVLDC